MIGYIISIVTCVTATIYHAVPEQTDDTPDITATGFKIDMNNPECHRIIAVSRDLEKLGFVMNAEVLVENAGEMNGVWTIRDRMNKRWTEKIDFLVNEEMKGGKWECIEITLIK
jgi:3D (Asp-Asp-Asp) domain-containing protein